MEHRAGWGLIVERQDADKIVSGAVTIYPDEAKSKFDIAIPQLTRTLSRSETPLDRLDPNQVAPPEQPLAIPDIEPDEYISYRGKHLISDELIEEYEFHVPYAEDASGVLTYYTRQVAKAGGVDRISGAFATLAPMVRAYICGQLFEEPVALDDGVVLKRLAENDAQQYVASAFQKVIRELSITEREPTIEESAVRLSQTPAFPWSRETVEAERTVFNLAAVDNHYEGRFAAFLDRAADVNAFAKLTLNSRFALEYINSSGALKHYYPDFVVRLDDDSCLIVETKGQEDVEVVHKDQRTRRWCRDASKLSGREWSYVKVRQKIFDAYTGDSVEGLIRFVGASEA